jgi:hypothetical protein
MVAQTMVRQMVSVVNTSTWEVALAHIDFGDSQEHWWSECADASPEESHKM